LPPGGINHERSNNMKRLPHISVILLVVFLLFIGGPPVGAEVLVQCPGDGDGDAIPDLSDPDYDPNVTCMHLTGSDGFANMADGRPLYMFSFADVTGIPEADVMEEGILKAAWPAPLIAVDEGMAFYLTLTNVGMLIRPDLFDPHTVHFHGFPNASSVMDGLPESGLSINMGASLTYYYNLVDPGTFMYHCHVEATEHMQMGMLGNLYVRPIQNRLPDGFMLGSWEHSNPDQGPPWFCEDDTTGCVSDADCTGIGVGTCNRILGGDDPLVGDTYVYNDGDGSTRYDVEAALQLGGFDPDFHDASWFVQPLPFALMRDRYPMINGRGYPDTVNTGAMSQPLDPDTLEDLNGPAVDSQVEHSLVTADAGNLILLRLSNLNITEIHTLTSPSIPMTVVGRDSRELRSTSGEPLHYTTNSVHLGGGMSVDVILDTSGMTPGTYFLYTSNLNYLSNNEEDFGGMMTEIVIN
jgi:FtsP/CotA-like multicopper oxidase with cupredoxin domain